MDELRNQPVVVFGASSGVGLATAQLLAVVTNGYLTGTVLQVDGGLPHSNA